MKISIFLQELFALKVRPDQVRIFTDTINGEEIDHKTDQTRIASAEITHVEFPFRGTKIKRSGMARSQEDLFAQIINNLKSEGGGKS